MEVRQKTRRLRFDLMHYYFDRRFVITIDANRFHCRAGRCLSRASRGLETGIKEGNDNNGSFCQSRTT